MIFIYPTDTAYALGCPFDDKKSIRKILKIKKRRDRKFTLIASSLAQVKKFFELNPLALRLAKKYWPGPLSIIVNDRFAVRVPDCQMARDLARRFGKPLIATSANLSGQKENYICPKMKNVDWRIDLGRLEKVKPSTIVDCRQNKIKIIRHGPINPTISF